MLLIDAARLNRRARTHRGVTRKGAEQIVDEPRSTTTVFSPPPAWKAEQQFHNILQQSLQNNLSIQRPATINPEQGSATDIVCDQIQYNDKGRACHVKSRESGIEISC